ncbi:Uncharacterised protein [Amycolatopsis camponoti]|uniref:Uncharacterized protein n=1 Tax=Amycolatopsis camponoti TaxID=2606593 RepID=A0A6I8LKM0_9PSEU|nr:Uncharacterised protein [Amycolatopsis camponoti]
MTAASPPHPSPGNRPVRDPTADGARAKLSGLTETPGPRRPAARSGDPIR